VPGPVGYGICYLTAPTPFVTGHIITIGDLGFYRIATTSVGNTQLVVQDLRYPENAEAGTEAPAGALVLAAGARGAQGKRGEQGEQGPTRRARNRGSCRRYSDLWAHRDRFGWRSGQRPLAPGARGSSERVSLRPPRRGDGRRARPVGHDSGPGPNRRLARLRGFYRLDQFDAAASYLRWPLGAIRLA
jgi:hypothetical protein